MKYSADDSPCGTRRDGHRAPDRADRDHHSRSPDRRPARWHRRLDVPADRSSARDRHDGAHRRRAPAHHDPELHQHGQAAGRSHGHQHRYDFGPRQVKPTSPWRSSSPGRFRGLPRQFATAGTAGRRASAALAAPARLRHSTRRSPRTNPRRCKSERPRKNPGMPGAGRSGPRRRRNPAAAKARKPDLGGSVRKAAPHLLRPRRQRHLRPRTGPPPTPPDRSAARATNRARGTCTAPCNPGRRKSLHARRDRPKPPARPRSPGAAEGRRNRRGRAGPAPGRPALAARVRDIPYKGLSHGLDGPGRVRRHAPKPVLSRVRAPGSRDRELQNDVLHHARALHRRVFRRASTPAAVRPEREKGRKNALGALGFARLGGYAARRERDGERRHRRVGRPNPRRDRRHHHQEPGQVPALLRSGAGRQRVAQGQVPPGVRAPAVR